MQDGCAHSGCGARVISFDPKATILEPDLYTSTFDLDVVLGLGRELATWTHLCDVVGPLLNQVEQLHLRCDDFDNLRHLWGGNKRDWREGDCGGLHDVPIGPVRL